MAKIKFSLLIIGLLICSSCMCQLFVNTENEWYLDDCCYIFNSGEIDCTTNKFGFGDPVLIGGIEYYPLIANVDYLAFPTGKYFRETNGKVFSKFEQDGEEFLIYDFNVGTGEQFEIGNSNSPTLLEVISIDSVTLNSGEKRKRIEVGLASDLDTKSFWIEGIGSELSTMNTLYMFTSDCWVELNCFHKNNIIEYQHGNCTLTDTEEPVSPKTGFSFFPNPATNQLTLTPATNMKIVFVEIIDLNGNSCIKKDDTNILNVGINGLPKGMYLLKAGFKNGETRAYKFMKN